MLKPQMPNIPGVAAVTDTLDFVKNLWGSMSVPGVNIPGMAAPTLSVDDLDKKIADLKAVESWLNVNVSMLRGTIQALEVQRGTIATLKSMGATLANAVKQPGANEKSVLAAAPYASAFFSQPAVDAATRAQDTAKEAAALLKADEKAAAQKVNPANPASPASPAASKEEAPMANPVLWWNALQDQFKQAVTTAMTSEAVTGVVANASNMAQEAAAKLTAASADQAAKLGKAMVKAAVTPAPKAEAKADKPAAKRAPAKRTGKSSSAKGD